MQNNTLVSHWNYKCLPYHSASWSVYCIIFLFWLTKAWKNIMRCMVSSSNNIISWLSYILQHPCIFLLLIFSIQVSIGKQKKHNRIIGLYKWKIEYLKHQTIQKCIPILSIILCRWMEKILKCKILKILYLQLN